MTDMIQLPVLAQRAQRIRDLVGTARTCIIEVGRELMAARRDIVGELQWEQWLQAEFSWSLATAKKFIAVAGLFGGSSIETNELDAVIEPGALYALAAPDVPQSARNEAITRAEAGEHISKAEAERMIASASEAAVQAAIEAERAAADERICQIEEEVALLRQQIAEAEAQVRAAVDDEMADAEKGGRGKIGAVEEAKKFGGSSDERVRQARTIVRYSLPLAQTVRDVLGGRAGREAMARLNAQ